MNDAAIAKLIADLIVREGGYVDNPADSGGPTKFGITLATLRGWRHKPVGAQDVQNLTVEEATDIYRTIYFTASGFDQIADPTLLTFMFDFGVNSGVEEASECLQRAIGVDADGVMGPVSLGALAAVKNLTALFYAVKAERLDFLLRDVGATPSQAEFAIGWSNRIRQFQVQLS